MRLFLAINLEPDLRRAIVDVTAPLRTAAPSLGWLGEARLHLTLKFLGEQPEDIVAPLSDSMRQVAQRHRQFSMELGEIGAFPNFRRPRVVWMGIGREPRLELLHHDLELACETHGLELEGRAFRPHLTLARARQGAVDATASVAALADFASPWWKVTSFRLVQSHLGAKVRHETLAELLITD